MARKPKPRGNYKPHSADKCGICAKPRDYRDRVRLNEAAFGDGGSVDYMSSSEIAQARRLNDLLAPLSTPKKVEVE